MCVFFHHEKLFGQVVFTFIDSRDVSSDSGSIKRLKLINVMKYLISIIYLHECIVSMF